MPIFRPPHYSDGLLLLGKGFPSTKRKGTSWTNHLALARTAEKVRNKRVDHVKLYSLREFVPEGASCLR